MCDVECVHCEIQHQELCVYKSHNKGSVYTIRGIIYAKLINHKLVILSHI